VRDRPDHLDRPFDVDPLTLDGKARRSLRKRLAVIGSGALALLSLAEGVSAVHDWAHGIGWPLAIGGAVALAVFGARQELWEWARTAWSAMRERVRGARAESYL
jgi:hypothetical protein